MNPIRRAHPCPYTVSATAVAALAALSAFGCAADSSEEPTHDPGTAAVASIDRFSASAGHLQVRTADNGLPEANAPVDFDVQPFVTTGLTPAGEPVSYYNFDVQPTEPALLYRLYEEGMTSPLAGQLDIIDVLPGEAGYSDFWRVMKVTVPAGTAANSYASLAELEAAGLPMEQTDLLVNAPIVPAGSLAPRRVGGASSALAKLWVQGDVANAFVFETTLVPAAGMVPTSPIWVTFNVNPPAEGGGPASGFRVEDGTMQTHNVVATVPGDAAYSPLWAVQVYDNAAFDSVMDATTAAAAPILANNVATVNCPIVEMPLD